MSPDIREVTMRRGSTLVEAVLAVGVLAVAVPLVFAALAGSAEASAGARAETRCVWMVSRCMEEIRASRRGRSAYLETTRSGESFPAEGDVAALAFSPEGRLIRAVGEAEYFRGMRDEGAAGARYVASIRGRSRTTTSESDAGIDLRIRIEYPAAAPAERRRQIEFHTRLP